MSDANSFSDVDRAMMARALQIAASGEFATSPNPMVGAVIALHGRIIGEGYHRAFGGPHAEVNAVAAAGGKEIASQGGEATIYVTLEPCSHYGKTPPCAKLLVECGFKRVVIAMTDPNPRVSGRGIAMLREAGIRVETGLMADEAHRLTEKFATAHSLGRVFVTLKWAQSADRFLDRRRTAPEQPAARISTPLSTVAVMKLRATNDAILVGSSTVIADNPSLTLRGFPGRQPRRVVVDRRQRISPDATLFANGGAGVIYLTCGHERTDLPTDVVQVCDPALADSQAAPEIIARLLHDRFGLISLLVEGGSELHRSFIDSGVWDRIRVEQSAAQFGPEGSTPAPELPADAILEDSLTIGPNLITTYRNSLL